MWSYSERNLKFAFKLYLCKIPNESPTAFFTPSFPGFRNFSLKVSNALKGILKRGYLQAVNSQSRKLSSFLISSVGTTLLSSMNTWKSVLIQVTTKNQKEDETQPKSFKMRQHPLPKKGEAKWCVTGNSAPLSSQLSSSLWCCLRQPLSGWAQPGSCPGLQLEKLKWAPAHEVSRDQRQHLQPISSPSCCFRPHSPPGSLGSAVAFPERSFPRWCHSNQDNTCPSVAGAFNALSARAGTQGEVCETFTSPLLFWGLAPKTGSQRPHYGLLCLSREAWNIFSVRHQYGCGPWRNTCTWGG